MAPLEGVRSVTFGDFVLDLQSGELSRNGSRCLLPQQPFRLLAILVREAGTVVTREELQRELWPAGTFVDFELGLNAAVKRLREALGDSASIPRYIETLPRRGYRFIAQVHTASASPAPALDASGQPTEAVPGEPTELTTGPGDAAPGHRAAWTARRWTRIAATAALLVVSVVAAIAFTLNRAARVERRAEPGSRITRMTTLGMVRLASLSPDGEHVAYVRTEGVRESLWIHKVSDSSAIQLLEPVDGTFRSLTLAGDGYVYFHLLRPALTAAPLQRLSLHDRAIETISEGASGATLSLDASRIAYVSTASMGMQQSHVVVGDPRGTNMRTLAVRQAPDTFIKEVKPAWSPDGAALAVFATAKGTSSAPQLVLLDSRDGRERGVRALGLVEVTGAMWLPGKSGLIVSGRERRVAPLRLWHVSVDSGVRRPLTHDVSDYRLAGVTRDGRRVVAVRGESARTFWVARLDNLEDAREVAADSGNPGGLEGIAWAPGDRLLYSTVRSDNLDIWSVDTRSATRRQLTTDPAEDYQPTVSADGQSVAFVSNRSGVPAIWSMSMDGTGERQLTTGNDSRPSFSPNGRWVAFQRYPADTLPFTVWRVPVDRGEATPLATHHTMRPAVSPDGMLVAHYWMTSERWMLAVTALTGGMPLRAFPLSRTHLDRVVRWSSDGRALAFIDIAGGASNIWLQPVDGGPARKLTQFAEGRITTFDWSPDGSKLAWGRTTEMHDVVAIDLPESAGTVGTEFASGWKEKR